MGEACAAGRGDRSPSGLRMVRSGTRPSSGCATTSRPRPSREQPKVVGPRRPTGRAGAKRMAPAVARRKKREGQPRRARDRRHHRRDQARPGALLRIGCRFHPAAPERPPLLARARAGRRDRGAVFPEAWRENRHSRHHRVAGNPVAWAYVAARGGQRKGAGRRRADERDRVPHVEFIGQGHRQARPDDFRP
jgi:hypothetical protein